MPLQLALRLQGHIHCCLHRLATRPPNRTGILTRRAREDDWQRLGFVEIAQEVVVQIGAYRRLKIVLDLNRARFPIGHDDLLETPRRMHLAKEVELGSVVLVVLVLAQEQVTAHPVLARMTQLDDLRRLQRAFALGDSDDPSAGYETILILRGDADVGILLVIDEDGERVGFRIMKIAADVLIVRLTRPARRRRLKPFGAVFDKGKSVSRSPLRLSAAIFVEMNLSIASLPASKEKGASGSYC